MKRLKAVAAIMITLSFLLSSAVVLHFFLAHNKGDTQKNLAIANHVYDSIYGEIMNPLMVSKTMAYDAFLQELLAREESLSEKEISKIIGDYLGLLKEKFNYSSVFVVSERTRRYYNESGILKVLNPQKVPYDIWYPIFIDGEKEYDLDTDRDQANDYLWTVFINIKIRDKNGELLGVCGVGVIMDRLQSLITELEDENDIKINLIDLEGLVQVDTNSTNIENAYISEAVLDKAKSDTFTISRKGLSGLRMVRFMKDLEWYVVVHGIIEKDTVSKKMFLLLFFLLALTLAIFFLVAKFFIKEKLIIPEDTLEDPLTGLPNRNYFKEAYGEMGVFTTTRYKTIAFFDVDNFENMSESMNSDLILKNIIQFSNAIFWDKGQLLRWDKDGFLALLETNLQESKENFQALCQKTYTELGITLSVGVVDINLSDTIKVNYYRAVQACYSVKESGGNGVLDRAQ